MPGEEKVALIDSHCHIQSAEFAGGVGQVVQRAREAGVGKIIVVGGAGDLSSNRDAVQLAGSFPGLFATVGMHPHDARAVSDEDFQALAELATSPKVIAIGETGLDFYYKHSPPEVQMDLFSRFIDLAHSTGLPLVVHNRESDHEVARLLRQEGKGAVRGVIHCFTGDFEAAKSFLDLGFYLSFSGIITFKNAEPLRDVVRRLPLERLLVETDSPYLAPVPHRGKRNEPAYVRLVAELLGTLKGLGLEQVAETTSRNAESLFRI
ncbi:MAG: TatD family hydrolase [Deltaproteobacteria bacterium]|nr:TatD family hydrolase [Deltaproteobacteria bacterium]